jgi:hypothetical protein
MDHTNLLKVVNDMFIAISSIAGYAVPAAPPPVHVIPAMEVQQMACAAPCRVRAIYLPERGIFIGDDLDFNNAYARSVLLHELVHHQQLLHAKFEDVADPCEKQYQQELEAYNVQNWYLKRHGQDLRFVIGQLPNMCAGDQRFAKPWMQNQDSKK